MTLAAAQRLEGLTAELRRDLIQVLDYLYFLQRNSMSGPLLEARIVFGTSCSNFRALFLDEYHFKSNSAAVNLKNALPFSLNSCDSVSSCSLKQSEKQGEFPLVRSKYVETENALE